MSWDDDFDRRFRRPRSSPRDFFGIDFDTVNRIIEEMSKKMAELMPEPFYREEILPDGTTNKEMGTFFYGYSMTVGPDGKPVIREFENVKPSDPHVPLSSPKLPLEYEDEREPLLDIIADNGTIRVLAELPGVEKNEIKLHCSEKALTISVNAPERRYYKEVELPALVDPKVSKATYKNGVLEVNMDKIGARKPLGESIRIE
ncbi:Hsp20/alpha crystallin family protein [Candidatus Bathyarchaeota archaeon]|nr:Hsp20/alpha crystallin family protein [Candidatus Bathyarchaeota archaeon]